MTNEIATAGSPDRTERANNMDGGTEDIAFLSDIVVLDLGDEATALAGEYLGELGATIIRVEEVTGDVIRQRGSLWNAIHNSGKKSIGIDLQSPEAFETIEPMLPGVDIVIGPIQPTTATKAFIDGIRPRHNHIGVVEVVARRDAPIDEAATDLTVAAAGGLTILNGHPDDPPNHTVGDLAWKQASIVAAEAALSLITARRRTGKSGHIVVSAQEAVAFTTCQTSNGNIYHWHKGVPGRHSLLAAKTTVESSDGKWTSFTIHPPAWPKFVTWAQRELGSDVLSSPEASTPGYLATNRDEVFQLVAALAKKTSRTDLIGEGQERGLLVLPVNTVTDVAADEHLNARDFYIDIKQDDGATYRLPGSPFRSSLGRAARLGAPQLDADRDIISRVASRDPMVPNAEAAGDPHQPLAGIRIVDFCWAMAGPLATRLLADLGADVIKIESENRLDPIRQIGPQPTETVSLDTNGVFHDGNANKRAATINLDTEQGRDLIRELIKTADVVTANYTPDRLDRWGFDAATLQTLRPGLIVANIAVMGLSGPNMGWRSYGSGIVAMGGIAAHTGFPGRVPECIGTLHTDFTVPFYAAAQILAALHHRDRTGEGAYLELAQYETAVRLLDMELAEVLQGQSDPGRIANKSRWHTPHGIFPAAGDDRWIAVACRDDHDREALAHVLQVSDLTDEAVAEWSKTRTREEAVNELRTAGVPAARVEDLADHQTQSPMKDNWATVDLPTGATAKIIHQPIIWDGERLPVRRGPQWMEHTYDVVVEELGLDPVVFAEYLGEQVLW